MTSRSSLRTCLTSIGVGICCLAFASNSQAEKPQLPTIPDKTFRIADQGAIGDGKTLNTEAIQKTIDAAIAASGGTVEVPEGKFLTRPLKLGSHINLHLAKGAELLIDDDLEKYPVQRARAVDCITATGATDVEISGEGTINGQGDKWWASFRTNPNGTHRPYMVSFHDCTRVLVRDITLTKSPMFHLVPNNCTDVTIDSITIKSPANAPNTDGIDPSGWNYLITNSTIDCGDDNIAIKPTEARNPGNKNFTVTNCKFIHGHGMSVGSGTNGGIEDLKVANCSFDSTDAGIRIKSLRGRGGLLQNVTYENLTMTKVKNVIYIVDYYPERTAPKDPATEKPEELTAKTPLNKNITIRNVTATDCTNAGTIRGLPEAPITDVTLTNVDISAKTGLKIYFAKGIQFVNSKIQCASGKKLDLFSAEVTGME